MLRLICFSLLLAISCQSGPLVAPETGNQNWTAFYKSIAIASTDQLPPARLQKIANKARVRVAAWTAQSFEKGGLTLAEELKVTLVPEAQDFCRKIKKEDLELRLRQRFGLPPLDEPIPSGEGSLESPTHFVIFEVETGDLFRPCRNPDISASDCQASWPQSVPDEHRAWFEKKRKEAHRIPEGRPFTMRGYSFDYSPQAKNTQGFTIFYVKKNSSVKIITSLKTENYCWR